MFNSIIMQSTQSWELELIADVTARWKNDGASALG